MISWAYKSRYKLFLSLCPTLLTALARATDYASKLAHLSLAIRGAEDIRASRNN